MSDEKTFNIKYRFAAKFGQFQSKDAVTSGEDFGVADAILLGLLVRDGGSLNVFFSMIDGEGNHNDMLMTQAWMMLTRQLAASQSLPPSLKILPEKYVTEIDKALGAGNDSQFH